MLIAQPASSPSSGEEATIAWRLNYPQFARYVVRKGSIAIDGISLTVAEVSPQSLAVWIIPHTKRHTNLGRADVGGLVNLEFDILAKYVERMLSHYAPQG